jgi:hypothetical protein
MDYKKDECVGKARTKVVVKGKRFTRKWMVETK